MNGSLVKDTYHEKKKYNCVLLGEGNLTFACAKALAESMLIIDAIITSHEKMTAWSKQNNIFCIQSNDDYCNLLKTRQFDYLICIINENKLSKNIIEQASICSINYHDSLLPHYAGVHATSWAILNSEKSHGITWHIMNNQIDSGDILFNKKFDISPTDTALTLNIKCFEAAITSLPELVKRLMNPPLLLTPQEKLLNNFYYKADKPQNNGIITSDMSLTTIQQFIHAGHFGHIDNDFYSTKIQIGRNFYILLEAQCFFIKHTMLAGFVTERTSQSIIVSFNEGYLHITKVADAITTLTLSELIQRESVQIGMPLALNYDLQLEDYRKAAKTNYAHERALSYYSKNQRIAELEVVVKNTLAKDPSFFVFYSTRMVMSESMFISLFCKFMSQYMQQLSIIVPIQNREKNFKLGYNKLFLTHTFIYADFSRFETLDAINQSVQHQLLHLPYIQFDINWRYRELKKSVILPPLLTSLESNICKYSPIVFNYHQNHLKILIAKDIVINEHLKTALNVFLDTCSVQIFS